MHLPLRSIDSDTNAVPYTPANAHPNRDLNANCNAIRQPYTNRNTDWYTNGDIHDDAHLDKHPDRN
jgi:hypothetical protein